MFLWSHTITCQKQLQEQQQRQYQIKARCNNRTAATRPPCRIRGPRLKHLPISCASSVVVPWNEWDMSCLLLDIESSSPSTTIPEWAWEGKFWHHYSFISPSFGAGENHIYRCHRPPVVMPGTAACTALHSTKPDIKQMSITLSRHRSWPLCCAVLHFPVV